MGSFFGGSSNITILGGNFNEVNGNLTVVDHSQHTTNLGSNNQYTNNVINAHNDNSTRFDYRGSDGEMPSMPSRSTGHDGYRREDHTRVTGPPPPQRPRFTGSPPQIPSTGGTVTNLNSFNAENTHINGVFNNNSQNYYNGGAPPDNIKQHNGPKWMPGPGPDQGTIPSISGPHGSSQFKAPVPSQIPFHAVFPQQMGVGGPPGPHMSMRDANIQQMDENMGQNVERLVKSTFSQAQSMVAGYSAAGGNYDRRRRGQAAYSSSSRNVEGSDSVNTRMANLSLNDIQPQTPTHRSPPTSSSDPQIGPKSTDQMGSSNPSTSNMSPYNNNFLFRPTETPPYGNNPNKHPPPGSTSPFNFPPSSSGGPNFNTHYGDVTQHDHSVHHTNIDSFNEYNNTLQDSFNDNSFVNITEKRSAFESNRKRGFPDPDVPKKTRKKNNGGPDDPDPYGMDEDPSLDETDEQIPTTAESTDNSSGKKKKGKKRDRPLFGRKS